MHFKFFFNIKLNKEFKFFKYLPNFLSSKAPIIINNNCKNINMIKCGATWKTTSKSRNKLLINAVNQYLSNTKKKKKILELAASRGISVYPNLKKNKIKNYILTDLSLNCYYKKTFFFTLLFLNKKNLIPFMAYNKFFILYSDNKSFNLIFNIFSFLIRAISTMIYCKIKKTPLSLLDNQILEYKKKYSIQFKEYNALSVWKGSKVNLIIALNLLNRSYFSNKLMNKIVSNVYGALKEKSLVIVGENKKKSKISIFKKINDKFILIENKGGKVDSQDIFLNFNLK